MIAANVMEASTIVPYIASGWAMRKPSAPATIA